MQDDVIYHVTTLTKVSEAKLQRVLDARFAGAFIDMQTASPNSKQRRKQRFRVGKLSMPPEIAKTRRAFSLALNNPGSKVEVHLGPYEIHIQLYKKILSSEEQLKLKNTELEEKLEHLTRKLESIGLENAHSGDMLVEQSAETSGIVERKASTDQIFQLPKPQPSPKRKKPRRKQVIRTSNELCWNGDSGCDEDALRTLNAKVNAMESHRNAPKRDNGLNLQLNQFIQKMQSACGNT